MYQWHSWGRGDRGGPPVAALWGVVKFRLHLRLWKGEKSFEGEKIPMGGKTIRREWSKRLVVGRKVEASKKDPPRTADTLATPLQLYIVVYTVSVYCIVYSV